MEIIKQTPKEKPVQSVYAGKRIGAWIWLAASVIYAVLPFDLIPDIPVIGWIDDFFLVSSAALNLIQQECRVSNEHLARIFQLLKWIMLFLGIVIILLVLLLGTLLMGLFTK